ncbi:DoxX-like family protein [Pelomonas sp. KK5]|uniref:DoxX-like family protein n=1 Tax=Pelomonas sp. KK5 TaxID=1855730 RepID=UPI001E4A0DDF|nr:DoxX-like family protein [Pelomonas sp. KK5]
MTPLARATARVSLVAVWLLTAVVSLSGGQGQVLLNSAGVDARWHSWLITGGACVDALLGLALWRWHRRRLYLVSAAAMLAMTMAATVLLPRLWLDPLGCLLKNLPIAALLYLLHEDAPA